MKAVIEILTALTFLFSSAVIAPKLVRAFKLEVLRKIDQGLPPLSGMIR